MKNNSAAASETIDIRDPRLDALAESTLVLPTLSKIAGKTLAILNNGWLSMDRIADIFTRTVTRQYGIEVVNIAIPIATVSEAALLDSIVRQADFAVVGLANWGSCTSWSVHDTVELTKRKMPSVVLVTERFTGLARAVKIGEGVPHQPSLVLPGNPEFYGDAELTVVVEKLVDDFFEIVAPGVPPPSNL